MNTLKTTSKSLSLMVFCFFALFSLSHMDAQTKTIKGMIDSDDGPIYGANVLLKGTNIGTTSDKDGRFTFPQPLKINDILVFSYLGFETMEIQIKEDTGFLNVMMTSDFIEITGAVATDKPYKSKRKKQKLQPN